MAIEFLQIYAAQIYEASRKYDDAEPATSLLREFQEKVRAEMIDAIAENFGDHLRASVRARKPQG